MNNNVVNTKTQIENTCKDLINQKLAIFHNPSVFSENQEEHIEYVTWDNHQGGRLVSGKNFNNISQYLAIITSGAYQLLLFDYSVIRCSFIFDMKGKIQSQNLLWWPCPIKDTMAWAETELGLIGGLKQDLDDIVALEQLKMRTPIRVDFDRDIDRTDHPSSHIHLQHHATRVRCNAPICFNTFMKSIFKNFYPDITVSLKNWDYLHYSGLTRTRAIEYLNSTVVSF